MGEVTVAELHESSHVLYELSCPDAILYVKRLLRLLHLFARVLCSTGLGAQL